MRFDLRFMPMVSAAAGVLAGLELKHRAIAVDHLTIKDVDPKQWDMVFLLAAETTFKIRDHMERIGDKLVVIATSKERGLDRWRNVFFPHWLFCVTAPQKQGMGSDMKDPMLKYDALLGRTKDPRTRLLEELEKIDALKHGIISYAPGNFYGPDTKLDYARFLRGCWDYEEQEIKDLYGSDLNYYMVRDSTLKLSSGAFSSCLIPRQIYLRTEFSLVAETDNVGDHVFVTEKTWKPILWGRPFIMYATPGHEDFLESLGIAIDEKTMGDPALTAELVKIGAEGDLIMRFDNTIMNNKRAADPHRWTSKLYSWLDRTVRT